MVKRTSKRAYHKQDMNKLNRYALIIGGVTAVIILLLIIVSFSNG
ncbi:MAG TPA: hypothetical protein VGL27_06275 [Negativicutes bacterium]